MTSISDVFDQLVDANTKLGQLHADLGQETTATHAVQTSVDAVQAAVAQVDTDMKTGFTAVLTTLATMAQIEAKTAELTFHLTQQADAMICALEHISHNTCGILTEVTTQTRLQTQLAEDARVSRFIAETVSPEAVLELTRLDALRAQTERCCPPDEIPPACVYRPCPQPDKIKELDLPDLPKVPRPRKQDG